MAMQASSKVKKDDPPAYHNFGFSGDSTVPPSAANGGAVSVISSEQAAVTPPKITVTAVCEDGQGQPKSVSKPATTASGGGSVKGPGKWIFTT